MSNDAQFFDIIFVLVVVVVVFCVSSVGNNKNVFRYWDMIQWVENAHIMDVIDDKLIIIQYELLHDLNKQWNCWPPNNLKDIKEWFLKPDDVQHKFYIPMKIKDYVRNNNTNNEGNQIFCALQYKNTLIGIIGFNWGDNKYMYNTTIPCDNGPPVRVICANAIAKGLFAQCIDLSDVSIPSSCGWQYIPLIDKNIIKKQIPQQQQKSQQQEQKTQQQQQESQEQQQNLFYDNKQMHSIGFTKQELHAIFSADFKEYYNVLGLAGQSSNYPCPWCLIHKLDNMEHVTTNNRCADPRHYGFQLQQNADVERINKNKTYPYGCKACPIYKYYPHTLGCPWVHQIGGICGGYIHYIFTRFVELSEEQQQQFEIYVQCEKDIHVCKSEIIINENLIKQYEEINIEIRADSLTPDIDMVQSQPPQQQSLAPEQEYFEQYDVDALREDLRLLKQQLQDLDAKYQQLKQTVSNYNRLKLWNEYKQAAGFEELAYRNQEVTGPNALKWVNNYQPLLDMLKPVDTDLYELCEFLMPCLKFILNVGAHKNLVPLSDECINAHKMAILQQESLGWKLIKLCRNEIDLKTRIPCGVKSHTLYHNHCRMEYTRMSTAYIDDQKTENNMKKCKHYVRYLRNQLNKIKVKSMVRKMNAEHGLRYDGTNKRAFK